MSPSRLMAVMDPLLNTGVLWRCLAAYAGITPDNDPPQDTTDNLPEQQQKVVNDSSSDRIESEEMHEDTYYIRLSK
jgi:hypothetical protein